MSYSIDPQTGEFLWKCPQCDEYIHLYTFWAIDLATQAEGCRGCRAKATLEMNPGLFDLFLDFWTRSNAWPQSHSWVEAIPITA